MMKEVVTLNGQVINIGPWDHQYFKNEQGKTIAMNPFPEGAVIEEREVYQDADGAWRAVGIATPKTELEQVKEDNARLNLQYIDLFELLIEQGVI